MKIYLSKADMKMRQQVQTLMDHLVMRDPDFACLEFTIEPDDDDSTWIETEKTELGCHVLAAIARKRDGE